MNNQEKKIIKITLLGIISFIVLIILISTICIIAGRDPSSEAFTIEPSLSELNGATISNIQSHNKIITFDIEYKGEKKHVSSDALSSNYKHKNNHGDIDAFIEEAKFDEDGNFDIEVTFSCFECAAKTRNDYDSSGTEYITFEGSGKKKKGTKEEKETTTRETTTKETTTKPTTAKETTTKETTTKETTTKEVTTKPTTTKETTTKVTTTKVTSTKPTTTKSTKTTKEHTTEEEIVTQRVSCKTMGWDSAYKYHNWSKDTFGYPGFPDEYGNLDEDVFCVYRFCRDCGTYVLTQVRGDKSSALVNPIVGKFKLNSYDYDAF